MCPSDPAETAQVLTEPQFLDVGLVLSYGSEMGGWYDLACWSAVE